MSARIETQIKVFKHSPTEPNERVRLMRTNIGRSEIAPTGYGSGSARWVTTQLTAVGNFLGEVFLALGL
jgi:hypothetical protein